MNTNPKRLFALMTALVLLASAAAALADDAPDAFAPKDGYRLEQVVILSRHNLRAPLSSNGSVPSELTPHAWTAWTAGSSELTLKGGILETAMGQFFRKWLDREGLIAENSVPAAGEVRFFAREKQRCQATARYFAAGLLPLENVEIEHPGEPYGLEDVMKPALHFWSEAYAADAAAGVAALGGENGMDGLTEELRPVIRLIMDTVDMQDSEIYRSGKYGDLLTDTSGYTVEEGKEPDLTGAVKVASQVADALILQYYEEPDPSVAAFGHSLTDEDWAAVGGFMSAYAWARHGTPLIAVNVTHPLLQALEAELKQEGRKFSFFCAHDVTLIGTLAALGVEPYTLPGSIEPTTPIGAKLMFERLRDGEGRAWYRVSLVYQSTEQLRSAEILTPDHPPMRYDLRFAGTAVNEDGLIAEADLFALLDGAIAAYEEMEAEYVPEELAPAA